ncbi:B-lymphocyte antigen CD20 [Heterocephalus glaber]|uniref:B-lymphocyte antigen CD20 n=1 Tax=Heterocephalus glaber TaxID=10181 RepID=A0AAX6QIZ7_HETGA|nr:B-lymphocyte antigen CD20 [Heterocephalus glaber]
MAAPGNSVSGTFPAGPLKGPMSVQPAQRENLQRVLPAVGPTQGFFMRESKALGAIQIMNGLFHLALGGLLMIPTGVHAPICLAVWYPLWGGVMFIASGSFLVAAEKSPRTSLIRVKVILNSLTLFAAITGIILLIMDILNIKLSHFLKMERLILIKTPVPYINIYNCEPAVPSEKNSPSTQYCYNIQSVFLGILSVMLTFAFFQKLVAAGIVEHEWKTLCSRSKANVVLLSAEEKKEQTIEIKEEMVELTEVSSQSKNEEEIEIIPVQEEEETEANFPEPPQDQISSPAENDSSP